MNIEAETEVIAGRNSVLEALKSGRPINKILLSKGEQHGSALEIAAKAAELGLIVQRVDSVKLDQLADGVKHQGVVALAAPVGYTELDDILEKARQPGETPFLLLLEHLNDPYNIGAILRTADAAGVHGVLLPKRRGCPLTQAVAKSSAGAVEYVPVARIGNVAATLKLLKKEGLWVIGADAAAAGGDISPSLIAAKDSIPIGGKPGGAKLGINSAKIQVGLKAPSESSLIYWRADFKRPLVLVIGSEGEGLSRLTRETCDFLTNIPMTGRMNSLNASVACSLLLYEVLRQRLG